MRLMLRTLLALVTLATVAAAQGAPDRAARLLGCAEAIRGVPNQGSREVVATTLALQEALGTERYAREYATTAAYSLEEVRAFLGAPAQVLRR